MILKYLKHNWIIFTLLIAYGALLIINALGINVWLPSCPIYSLTGMECFGCGLNRATIALLQFDISHAWHHNPLIFLYLAIGGGLLIYNFRTFINKHKQLT